MKRLIASTGVALVMLSAAAATHADDSLPEINATVTNATSASRQTSSEVGVDGTWSTEKLMVGQKFTVSSATTNGGAPFTWNASFPFTLDDGTVIGECEADSATLTCKVTEIPASYVNNDDAHGSWWARARLQGAAVGTTEGQITVNGKAVKTLVWGDAKGTGTCTSDCDGPVHYEYANPSNTKFGWTNDNGTIGWAIKLIATGGAEYTVKDFDTRLGKTVRCTKSNTWNPATTEIITATQVNDNTIKFTAPEGAKTCILYTPEQMKIPEGQTSLTNHAEINGIKLEATATRQSNGGATGGATVAPQPTPTPEQPKPPAPDTEQPPAPTPTPDPTHTPEQPPAPAPTPDPTPTPTPTPDKPKPTPEPSTPPAPDTEKPPAPVPSEPPAPEQPKPPAPAPTPEPSTPPTPTPDKPKPTPEPSTPPAPEQPKPSATPTPEQPKPGNGRTNVPSKPSYDAPKSQLARTGMSADIAVGAAALATAGGVILVARKRRQD